MVEHLLTIHEALDSISSTTKENNPKLDRHILPFCFASSFCVYDRIPNSTVYSHNNGMHSSLGVKTFDNYDKGMVPILE